MRFVRFVPLSDMGLEIGSGTDPADATTREHKPPPVRVSKSATNFSHHDPTAFTQTGAKEPPPLEDYHQPPTVPIGSSGECLH